MNKIFKHMPKNRKGVYVVAALSAITAVVVAGCIAIAMEVRA